MFRRLGYPLSLLAFSAALVVIAGPGFVGQARADVAENHQRFVANAVDGYIRPEFEHFSQTLHGLETAIDGLCEAPDAATYSKAQAAYSQALAGFARINFLRFGPLIEDHRLERLVFWPDRKSIGRRQEQQVICDRDESVLALESLQEKSVVVQGLLALEPVHFSTRHARRFSPVVRKRNSAAAMRICCWRLGPTISPFAARRRRRARYSAG
ncbi:imelysin family protein [Breoghania sp.]|uniref:imelysin family protein n=1 Tax=Breoghania sp. TaxID=2065378 RepID=UPI002629C6FD|nr:imelysin family protein [Breoghania sp.]MDJ0932632.1 imelysin family protein [Breoghania sp.]